MHPLRALSVDVIPERYIRYAAMTTVSFLSNLLLYQDEYEFLFADNRTRPTYRHEHIERTSFHIGQVDRNTTFTVAERVIMKCLNVSFFNVGSHWRRIEKRGEKDEYQIKWVKMWPIVGYYCEPSMGEQVLLLSPINNIHWGSRNLHFTILGMAGNQESYSKLLPIYFEMNTNSEKPESMLIPVLSLYIKNNSLNKKRILGFVVKDKYGDSGTVKNGAKIVGDEKGGKPKISQ